MSRSRIVLIALLLIVGNNLTHLWGWLPKDVMNEPFDSFLKPGFHLYDINGVSVVTVSWYIKQITDDLNMAIIFFSMAMISESRSDTMFAVAFIFFLYQLVDAFLLAWNFKQTKETYWVSSVVVVSCIYFLLRPTKMRSVK
jgi:hypothetical protein